MIGIIITAVVAYCVGHHCGELHTRHKTQRHLSELEQGLLVFYNQQPVMVAISLIQVIRAQLLRPTRESRQKSEEEKCKH